MKISQEQIQEWTESEVTIALKEHLVDTLNSIRNIKANTYFQGEPYRTQEAMANLIASEVNLMDLIEICEGTWNFMEEDSEPERD